MQPSPKGELQVVNADIGETLMDRPQLYLLPFLLTRSGTAILHSQRRLRTSRMHALADTDHLKIIVLCKTALVDSAIYNL